MLARPSPMMVRINLSVAGEERLFDNEVRQNVVDYLSCHLNEQYPAIDYHTFKTSRRLWQDAHEFVRKAAFGDTGRQRFTARKVFRDTWRKAF